MERAKAYAYDFDKALQRSNLSSYHDSERLLKVYSVFKIQVITHNKGFLVVYLN